MNTVIIKDHFGCDYSPFYSRYIEINPNGNGQLNAKCPFHEDKNPSLSIDRERGLFKCHGCNAEGDIFHFYALRNNLNTKEDFPKVLLGIAQDFGISIPEEKPRLIKTYDYQDENGQLKFQVCRMEPKGFRQRQPDGRGGYIGDVKGVKPILYRLPEVQAAREVLIVEGEKDVETARALGLTATCNPGGAGKWRPEYSEYLRGKNIVLIPDNDAPGRKHMNQVGAATIGIAASIKWLELPDLPEKGDLTDFVNGQADQYAALERLAIKSAPEWNPTEHEQTETPEQEQADSSVFKLTDLGNAERLVRMHGQDIRFCHLWVKWLVWDGKRWTIDDQGEIYRRAKMTVRSISREISQEMEKEKVEALLKHAGRSESESSIRAMVNLARMERPVRPNDLDQDQYLFNIQNGVLDLRTGKLHPHQRKDMISKIAPVMYDPTATCPLWEKFLDRVFEGEVDLIEYMRRVAGYSLTGDISEQCFFLLIGEGQNGKSTLLETLRALVHDYGHQANFHTFLAKRMDNGQSNDLAGLKGARVVTAIEAGAGRALNEALIKTVTGGEPVSARFLYGEFFEFQPQFKLFLATNHKPRIRDTDWGIWRRVRLIPFEVQIPPAERDLHLKEKLLDELPGILNWAIAGCLEWQQRASLSEPKKVLLATGDYRNSEDILSNFFEECCGFSPAARANSCDLKKAYTAWCEANSEEPVSNRVFATYLEARGCKRGRDRTSRYWQGVDFDVSV